MAAAGFAARLDAPDENDRVIPRRASRAGACSCLELPSMLQDSANAALRAKSGRTGADMPSRMRIQAQPLIAVRDVAESSRGYQALSGCQSEHGGGE